MEKERMKKFKLFWAWEDEKEEKWLEEMSRQGWHLEAPGFPGFYHFTRGEPRAYSYCLDFRTGNLKSLEEYRQICRDSGWEELGRVGSWRYFRKEFRGAEKPEFFSDRHSKVQKYQRLVFFLLIFLPILLNGLRLVLQRETSWALTVSVIAYLLLIFGWIVAMIKLAGRIRRLKRD